MNIIDEGNEEYYQRMLNGERLSEIRSYLGLDVSASKPTNSPGFFPNNIIVAFFSQSDFFKPKFIPYTEEDITKVVPNRAYNFVKDCELGILVFPKKYRTCWVIDGQHRLFSFADVTQPFLDKANKQRVLVTAVEDIGLDKQRKIFLDINQEQKPVHPDLIWDIIGEAEPKCPDGIIANTVKKLDLMNPFYRRFNIPSRGIRQRGQFSLNSLCKAIEKTKLTEKQTKHHKNISQQNLFYSSDKEVISNKLSRSLSNYFSFLDKFFEKGQFSGFFTTEIGWITIALYIFERIISISTKIPDDETWTTYFNLINTHIIKKYNEKDAFSNLRSMSSGEANKEKVVKEFLIAIRESLNDPKFNWDDLEQTEEFELVNEVIELEIKLRKLINKQLVDNYDRKWYLNNNYLPKNDYDKILERLIKDQQRNPNIKEEDIYNYLDMGKILLILENHKNKFETIFKNKFPDYNLLISMLKIIKEIRDPTFHGRDRETETSPINNTDLEMIKLMLPKIREAVIEFLK